MLCPIFSENSDLFLPNVHRVDFNEKVNEKSL
jgi:hypothetical protein